MATSPIDDPVAIRRCGGDWLSLALIDARNRLLARLAADESPAALRRAAAAGCFQEWWIARHVQRGRGERCDPAGPRLAGVEPRAGAWASGAIVPPADALRGYLAETLETTLDLLMTAPDDDDALHFYRLALQHEDRLAEAIVADAGGGSPPARSRRDAVWLPAQRWGLGSPPGGYVPHNERWMHEVAVPESEIDAQPVDWGRFVEFADDGGYDREALWSPAGWGWLQAGGRRAPGRVEQLHGGVVVERGGALQRAPVLQPVMHANRHEAEAWCRWAGRRLPTEVEWEIAACSATGRGFAWGDVFEWVAGSARAYPGAGADPPGTLDPIPPPGTLGVLRGASFATPARWRHPRSRRFEPPGRDTMFCGFRSCAL